MCQDASSSKCDSYWQNTRFSRNYPNLFLQSWNRDDTKKGSTVREQQLEKTKQNKNKNKTKKARNKKYKNKTKTNKNKNKTSKQTNKEKNP